MNDNLKDSRITKSIIGIKDENKEKNNSEENVNPQRSYNSRSEIDKGAMSARVVRNILQKEESKKIPFPIHETEYKNPEGTTLTSKLSKSKSVKNSWKSTKPFQVVETISKNIDKISNKELEVTPGRITLNSKDDDHPYQEDEKSPLMYNEGDKIAKSVLLILNIDN